MKARMPILVISIFLLWSSLPANHHFHLPGKQKSEFASSCCQESAMYDKDVILKKIILLPVGGTIDLGLPQITPWIKEIKTRGFVIARQVHYYLLFRVLRQ